MLFSSQCYRTFLSQELLRRSRANPRYSQRSFAKQLGLSPGELSEILRGKRGLSLKSVLKVSRGLGLSPEETRRLVLLTQMEKSRALEGDLPDRLQDASEKPDTMQLSLDIFALVSDWYHFAILSLAETEGFRWNSEWIAKRLGVNVSEVRIAIERLIRAGLLEEKKGILRLTGENLSTPDGISSEAIRHYHRQILQKAQQALDTQDVDDREVGGISVAIPRRAVADFKKDVSRFLDEMGAKYGSSRKKQEVYQLEVALFRLSNGETR